MRNRLKGVSTLLAAALGLLVAMPAWAASLQQVSSWGASGVPTYIAMYIYVPDKVATNPPILVVAHYCGGDAAGVFGEAQSGGIVAAADKYGFIMVYPQNHLPGTTRNCWDVGSTASLTHDGGGDTQAIAQMVKYTITTYKANADRVYATGTSSGAMMTEALLAVYPDVFKAGSEFSGVPAGCWADGYSSSNQWSGNCAGGKTTFTAQQWGDKVRAMYPGYSGHRPRVQLWHGAADSTISPNNQTEAIKEWTNVLGLDTNPTSTTTVSLNSHSWTRQSWQNACGFTVLDAWLEANGPHGTDANFNATYTIPFLGLDQTGATDPEITQCGSGGTGGSTGAGGTGGSSSTGGSSGGRDGSLDGARDTGSDGVGDGRVATTGGSVGSGGATGAGGSVGTGGGSGSGGAQGGGGSQATGGSGSGGNSGVGGGGGKGGAQGSGGSQGTGGSGSGGALGSGGLTGSGGSTANGGGAGNGSGGTSSTGGTSGGSTTTGGGSGTSGCGCTLGAGTSKKRDYLDAAAVVLGLGLLALARRRRRAAS